MGNIAACLLAFDRPHYLRQTVSALEDCIEKDEMDWYLFQDGRINQNSGRIVAEDRDLEICNNILQKADFPNKEIIQNEWNEGIALQYSKALELLDGEYDAIVTFEDDVIVSKYALRLSRVIMRNFPQHVPTIYSRPDRNDEYSIDDYLDMLIRCRTAAFHTTAISSRIYEHIRDRYLDYIEMVSEWDYKLRNHGKIKDEFGSRLSSHDSVVNKLLTDFGYERIRPAISRAIYIGMEGEHYDKDTFINRHRNESRNIEFEIDKAITNFRSTQTDDNLF